MIKKEIVDLKKLSWTKTKQSSGTAGSYLKSYSYSNGKKVYYKLSFFDDINGIFGYESVNEIISLRIMELLGYNHLKYDLIHGLILIDNKEYTPLDVINMIEEKWDSLCLKVVGYNALLCSA